MPAGEQRLGRARALNRAPSIHVPSSSRSGVEAGISLPSDKPSLRLALAKGTLGIELDAPFRLGPLTVTELALSYAGVRFPIDLSGGVARFRHRRGELT